MGNIFNDDFRDFIAALNLHNVRYILVGGYSVILNGYRRTTGDLDLWIDRTEENMLFLNKACSMFGLSTNVFDEDNFLHNNENDVYTFGRSPVSIDIMLTVKGLEFNEA